MPRTTENTISKNMKLMEEWDYEKNDLLGFDPSKIGQNSHYKAWWKCTNGHSWQAMISNRSRHNRGCPYCAHQLPIKGETDLATCYPNLVKEWHPEKNSVHPDEVMPGTHKKAWWICSLGHEWQAEIKSRTTGIGCPYCAGKKVLKGFNDLASQDPELAKEWHPEKNGNLTPEDVTVSSGKKVWWLCKNRHEFLAAVYIRKSGRGCPYCAKALRTSFPEQAVYYYIKQVFPDAINSYKEIFSAPMELDIYVPSIKTGIEYDGKVYHSSADMQWRDSRKYEICRENGIMLVRIVEIKRHTPILTCDHKIEIPNASDEYLNWAINNLCYHLGKIVVPDVKRDRREILALLDKRNKSLVDEYPNIAEEWDYVKNAPLVPENFAPHSNERVYWICKTCGYSWVAAIGDRTREEKTGCPKCSRQRGAEKTQAAIVEKRGSLAQTNPELLQEWDYDKNAITPNDITAGSGKKVYWICKKCGYGWSASIDHRVDGRGCPVCSNRIIIPGHNDLASLRPDLINEWDYDKNTELDPTHIAVRSSKKAHWKCSTCGYEWVAAIYHRTGGRGCPMCANKRRGKRKSSCSHRRRNMDIQNDQSILNEDIIQDTSDGRKIYPITEEILEAGERAFHRAIEEERARAKAERNQNMVTNGDEETADLLVMTPSKPTDKTDPQEELILTPSFPDEQPESADLTLESSGMVKVKEITFDGEEDAAARIEEAMMAYDKAMNQAAGIE